VFSDHVSLPFKLGFTSVYKTLAEQGVHEKVVFIGSGRLGFPEQAMFALALGCDMINVAREAMLSIGCIQAQECHTGKCPTGIATQTPWLVAGVDPMLKSARLANYLLTLRKEMLSLAHACGAIHPGLVPLECFDIVGGYATRGAREVFGYRADWGLPDAAEQEAVTAYMRTILDGKTPLG
jgi:glutamate synthase domain-containing protein 2